MAEQKLTNFPGLSQPAQRALINAGYKKFSDLKNVDLKELLKLHGFGPKSIPAIKKALE
jgi:excinuclease UvrABC nuclease subunit